MGYLPANNTNNNNELIIPSKEEKEEVNEGNICYQEKVEEGFNALGDLREGSQPSSFVI